VGYNEKKAPVGGAFYYYRDLTKGAMMLNCPVCKSLLTQDEKSYRCSNCSFSINKVILSKEITPQIVEELCQNGETSIIEGFVSKKGKSFNAQLVMEGGKVKFRFPGQKEAENSYIRVHSGSPGIVDIRISGSMRYAVLVDFGLVSSRMAECLGVIAAVKWLKHYGIKYKLNISANNKEFVEYMLRETTPRKKDMREAIQHLWQVLEPFQWDIVYKPKQRIKLQGGASDKNFPQGLFPWLKLDKSFAGKMIYVKLPGCPAVQAQLLASIRTAQKEEGSIAVPVSSEKTLTAWELVVTKEVG